MELREMTAIELKALAVEIKAILVEKREERKVNDLNEKTARAEDFKAELKAGDLVSFLFGRENILCEGTIVRASEVSATVESESFAKGKNYVRFDRFVKILETAEVEETEAVEIF